MNDIFLSKLNAILKIEPKKDNEALIRNLCHRLLSEISTSESEASVIRDIRKDCLVHIRKLQLDKIIGMKKKDCAYRKYDFSLLISNICEAIDVLMTKSGLRLFTEASGRLYTVCDAKIVFYALSGMMSVFFGLDCRGDININVKSKSDYTVLSAVCVGCKPKNEISDKIIYETDVLRKTASLHSGKFFLLLGKNSVGTVITFSKSCDIAAKPAHTPHYIDLLLDRTSDIYVGMSFLDDYMFR